MGLFGPDDMKNDKFLELFSKIYVKNKEYDSKEYKYVIDHLKVKMPNSDLKLLELVKPTIEIKVNHQYLEFNIKKSHSSDNVHVVIFIDRINNPLDKILYFYDLRVGGRGEKCELDFR